MIFLYNLRNTILLSVTAIIMSSCAETQLVVHGAKEIAGTTKRSGPNTKGYYKVGKPYRIENTWYYPAEDFNYTETGIASWYGPKFHLRRTANGETFDMNALTAAHRTLPMPSMVRVINLSNGRSLRLRINDRGPFARNRIIDVSRRAAQLLGFQRKGTASVRVEIIPDESQRMKMSALNRKISNSEQIVAGPVTREVVIQKPIHGQQATIQSIKLPPKRAKVETTQPSPINVKNVPVADKNQMYVQVGAYIDFANASKVRIRMSDYGPAWLSEKKVGGQKFFRVRIGPMLTLERADKVLSQLISSGFPRAKIVID